MIKFYILYIYPYLNITTKKTLEAYKELAVIQVEKALFETPKTKNVSIHKHA